MSPPSNIVVPATELRYPTPVYRFVRSITMPENLRLNSLMIFFQIEKEMPSVLPMVLVETRGNAMTSPPRLTLTGKPVIN